MPEAITAAETATPAKKSSPKVANRVYYPWIRVKTSVPAEANNELDFITTQEGNSGPGFGFEEIYEDGQFIMAKRGDLLLRIPLSNCTGGPVLK